MKKKHILYASCLCSKRIEQEILKDNPKGIGLQVQKYHRLLARGFLKNGLQVSALSYHKAVEERYIPSSHQENEDGIEYNYILAKHGYREVLKHSFLKAYKVFKENKDAVVICDVLNLTVSFGAMVAARMMRREVIGIITDFPEQMGRSKSVYSRMVWNLIRACTGYIVLTGQMKERLNPKKPTIVLEGHVDSDIILSDNRIEKKQDKKVCLYAGMLHRKYGIENLVKAFSEIKDEKAELHIYGDGDFASELMNNTSEMIRYHGIVSNQTVVEEEIKATLLINPRPTKEEFTKYSFPSKNMEYMASGTPLLTTNLPGMPKEYLDYVYILEDESVEGMAETIGRVLSKTKEALHEKGMAAREFVLREKNETAQAKRIIDMLL